MEPSIVEKGEITLVGFSFYGDPFNTSGEWTEENEIGRLWNRFIGFLAHNSEKIKHVKNAAVSYEVHIEHEETALKGNYEIFVGVEVEKLEELPVQLLVKNLPPSGYAVFTLHGSEIASDWNRMIFYDWLPGSGYQIKQKYSFQYYDQRFKGLQNLEESVLDVYIPIVR